MPKSTSPRGTSKPDKPHKDYPLYAHASGRWAKKVRGKLEYIGKWSEPKAALEKWLADKDDLLAGRRPRPRTGAATVDERLVKIIKIYGEIS